MLNFDTILIVERSAATAHNTHWPPAWSRIDTRTENTVFETLGLLQTICTWIRGIAGAFLRLADTWRFSRFWGRELLWGDAVWAVVDGLNVNPALEQISRDTPGLYRFIKSFGDRDPRQVSGPQCDLVPSASLRAASHLLAEIYTFRRRQIRLVSDSAVSGRREGTFLCFGSSASNGKSLEAEDYSRNRLLHLKGAGFYSHDASIQELQTRNPVKDKGLIQKVYNPGFPGHYYLVCAGLGEWGTSGAAWYLARHWRALNKRFASSEFAVVVEVTPGADESAAEVRSVPSTNATS